MSARFFARLRAKRLPAQASSKQPEVSLQRIRVSVTEEGHLTIEDITGNERAYCAEQWHALSRSEELRLRPIAALAS
jgi:hypothetical protein